MTRVTQNMMNSQLMRNLNYNLNSMKNLQNQLSTGRRINMPSDDPVGISFSMRYRTEIGATEQFVSNADTAMSWLDYTDTVLNQLGNVLQRTRELCVQGANGTNDDNAMVALKQEVVQLKNQALDVANSEFNGKFVFNGQLTDRRPYPDPNNLQVESDPGIIHLEIGAGVTLGINVTATQVYGNATDDDQVFKLFDDMMGYLEESDYVGMSNLINKIQNRLDTVLQVRSDIGAKTNRIELANGRLEDISINLQSLQSKTEDADIAEVITNLKTYENVYQASLSTGAKLISPSLVDFLK
ncbi:flagellar hook-associated protein FlgL [Paenibacillus koleovorans]|uniref:flagellar hook-associated protein FlgL n=1 Tax=Paenibacillus koleovorans TaxID=121608 RepID=UPI001FE92644|nr:flagellar hook-associated protein FlgL [Paenibacillus koleovorans]